MLSKSISTFAGVTTLEAINVMVRCCEDILSSVPAIVIFTGISPANVEVIVAVNKPLVSVNGLSNFTIAAGLLSN